MSGARNRKEYISIHAPTRGATTGGGIFDNLEIHFNPRSYKRSDCNPCHNCTEVIISIHAPTRGATWCYFFVLKFSKISIHAPTRGATKRQCGVALSHLYFNPRSYKRSDCGFSQGQFILDNFNPRSYKRSDDDYED